MSYYDYIEVVTDDVMELLISLGYDNILCETEDSLRRVILDSDKVLRRGEFAEPLDLVLEHVRDNLELIPILDGVHISEWDTTIRLCIFDTIVLSNVIRNFDYLLNDQKDKLILRDAFYVEEDVTLQDSCLDFTEGDVSILIDKNVESVLEYLHDVDYKMLVNWVFFRGVRLTHFVKNDCYVLEIGAC